MHRTIRSFALVSLFLVAPTAHAQGYDVFNGTDVPPRWAETLDLVRPRESGPHEPAAPRFGAQGEFVVTGSTSMGVSSERFSNSSASTFSVGFSPGFDYFVLPNVSIGLTGAVSYADTTLYDSFGNLNGTKTTSVSVAPRLGYNVPFGDYVSWYPRVAFGIASTHTSEQSVTPLQGGSGTAPYSFSAGGPWVNAFAPILVHPAPHFFVGAGPGFEHTFADMAPVSAYSGQPTEIFGEVVVGGWWGGTPTPASDDRPEPPKERLAVRRFGEATEWVFTGETSIYASSTRYSAQGSYSSVNVAPGFDYFVVDDFSVGADVYGTYAKTNGVFSGSTTTTTYGIAAHVAVNLPLGRLLSLYPRGYFGFGGETDQQSGDAGSSQVTHSVSWAALYVPLLVHPAPHVFVGFGPSVRHELSSDFTYSSGQQSSNPGTVLSANLIVGGWL